MSEIEIEKKTFYIMGCEDEQLRIVKNMIRENISLEIVSEVTGLTINRVQQFHEDGEAYKAGRETELVKTVKNMIRKNISLEIVSEVTGLTINRVQQIHEDGED
jgi:hypothetical protein